MRACVIAAAIVALSQPAFAAKTHKKNAHRHHVSHLSHHHVAKHHRAHARVRRTPIETRAVPDVRAHQCDRYAVLQRPVVSGPVIASVGHPCAAF